jgi:protein-disulfide isomerase
MKMTIVLLRYLFAPHWIVLVTGFWVICLTLFSYSTPAKADSQISPQLKEQVLQIIQENPEAILGSVQAYQSQQQLAQQKEQQAFLQQTKTNPKALIGSSPTRGAKSGQVLLVEFSDFQCPYCRDAHAILQPFMAKHNAAVTLVYKHFPLISIHTEAMPAAKAAWAAGQQGKFWEYHEALFTHQDQLGEAIYQATAKTLNLDLKRFDRDRDNAEAPIQQDIVLGKKLGLSGTPFFVMNGETFSGVGSVEALEQTLARVSKA